MVRTRRERDVRSWGRTEDGKPLIIESQRILELDRRAVDPKGIADVLHERVRRTGPDPDDVVAHQHLLTPYRDRHFPGRRAEVTDFDQQLRIEGTARQAPGAHRSDGHVVCRRSDADPSLVTDAAGQICEHADFGERPLQGTPDCDRGIERCRSGAGPEVLQSRDQGRIPRCVFPEIIRDSARADEPNARASRQLSQERERGVSGEVEA